METRVFIGSSGESHDLAVALQSLLERNSSVTVWSQGVFEQNKSNLENLMRAANEFDFACFLATADDFVVARGSEFRAPRDNIFFEFGLFLGAMGPDRVFLLHPRDQGLKIPSDLGGVSLLDFKPPAKENPFSAVLAPSALAIGQKIAAMGPRSGTRARRYSPILEKNGLDRISSFAEAALYFPKRRFGYRAEIRDYIRTRRVVPARYYYITEEGAEFWMNMSADPRYKFHNDSLRLVRSFAPKVAARLGRELDFISIGSGDGEKDRVLLEAALVSGTRSIVYYPIDISDKLLVECVRNVFTGSLAHSSVRTRAILGDFCDLGVLRAVYEDRPCPNVFVVLGNTLGNTDEASILNALKDAMYPGDYLIVEVNCATTEVSENTAFLRSDFVLEYCRLPLSIIGLNVSLSDIEVRDAEDLSVFKSARSVQTSCKQVTVDGEVLLNVPLSYDHRYDFRSFCDELSAALGVEILCSEERGNAGILLAQKSNRG